MATNRAQAGVCNIPNRSIFEGDNLDVMRGMNDGCVDLIYLDPPFNSNRDYAAPIGSKAAGAAFKDTWDLTDVDEAWHNEIAETDLALYKYNGNTALGFGATVRYYEVQPMNATVVVAISVRPGFPFNGVDMIKTAVNEYLNGLSIGEIVDSSDLTFAILSTGNLSLTSVTVSGSAGGQIFGGGINPSAVTGAQSFVLNGENLTITVPAGSSGTDIAVLLQTAINADANFNNVTVTHRTSDGLSHFDVRGLPATATTLASADALFGTSSVTVNGAVVTNLIGSTLAFNQRVITSDSAITVSTN